MAPSLTFHLLLPFVSRTITGPVVITAAFGGYRVSDSSMLSLFFPLSICSPFPLISNLKILSEYLQLSKTSLS